MKEAIWLTGSFQWNAGSGAGFGAEQPSPQHHHVCACKLCFQCSAPVGVPFALQALSCTSYAHKQHTCCLHCIQRQTFALFRVHGTMSLLRLF